VLRGASIICLSSIDWEFNRQNPQEVASAFAESGNWVLFIENTGLRRPALRDVPRLWTRLRNWLRAAGGVRPLGNGIDLHSPLLIPLPYSRLAGFINTRAVLRIIQRWLSRDPGRPLIVITFLPTPLALSLIHRLDPSLVVYYCIDRLAQSSPGARKLRYSEAKLFAKADLVLITAEGLRSADMRAASRVEIVPSGVRYGDFEQARRSRSTPPPLFDGLTGPIAGFAGSLRDQTDLELLEHAAALAPDLNFVFVGPLMTDVKRLAAHANVRLAGSIVHQDVIRHMVHFDVGILPYVLDDYTAGIMPAKLREYLAAGLPVVSTPLPEVCRFAEKHVGVIDFASDAQDFAAAIRAAVSRDSPAAVERRLEVARRYDWSALMERLSDWMEALLTAR